jgi:transposase
MSGKFQTIDRDIAYLLPPSLQDWLPEKHLARFVVDIVDRLDLRELERCYGGGGKPPYYPALLLAMLFYGMPRGCSPAARRSRRVITRWRFDSSRRTRIRTTLPLRRFANVF